MKKMARGFIAVIVGSFIFVGLPLLAWGLNDVQRFVAHPARLGYIVLGVLVQGVVAVYFPGAGRSGSKGETLVRRQQVAVVLLQVFSLTMVIAVPYLAARGIGQMDVLDLAHYLGLTFFVTGFLLMNWSAAVLGRQFSTQVTLQNQHQLVTEGPYSLVRHPRYLGIIMFNLGIALVFISWLGVFLTVALALVLIWRIYDEEILLSQAFGQMWVEYRQQSWRLIPYVW